jgi:hypothetical protein
MGWDEPIGFLPQGALIGQRPLSSKPGCDPDRRSFGLLQPSRWRWLGKKKPAGRAGGA